jgi:hypothetical protein
VSTDARYKRSSASCDVTKSGSLDFEGQPPVARSSPVLPDRSAFWMLRLRLADLPVHSVHGRCGS